MRRLLLALVFALLPTLASAQSTINLSITTTAAQDSGLRYLMALGVTVGAQPGTGYTVGDVLTVTGGTCTTAPTFTVTGIGASGAVSTVAVKFRGDCTVYPSNPLLTTGGTGTGARLKWPHDDVAAMLTKYLNDLVGDYRVQWKNAQRKAITDAVEGATNNQLNSTASTLKIILP